MRACSRRGGTLVVYGNAAAGGDRAVGRRGSFAEAARAGSRPWNALPNGRRAGFYNVWAGQLTRRAAFRRRLRTDLGIVLDLLRQGVIVPQIAARYPLSEVSAALVFAENRSRAGKVVLEP